MYLKVFEYVNTYSWTCTV